MIFQKMSGMVKSSNLKGNPRTEYKPNPNKIRVNKKRLKIYDLYLTK